MNYETNKHTVLDDVNKSSVHCKGNRGGSLDEALFNSYQLCRIAKKPSAWIGAWPCRDGRCCFLISLPACLRSRFAPTGQKARILFHIVHEQADSRFICDPISSPANAASAVAKSHVPCEGPRTGFCPSRECSVLNVLLASGSESMQKWHPTSEKGMRSRSLEFHAPQYASSCLCPF